MQYSAWLRADVEVKGLADGESKRRSRLKRMQDENGEDFVPDMPPCGALFLVGYLMDVGPALPGAMGSVPLSEVELRAWQENTGIYLSPWQSRFLKRLSSVWIEQQGLAAKEECPSPWLAERMREEKEKVAVKLKALFRS